MDLTLLAHIKSLIKKIPKGDKGDKGDKGEEGFTRVVNHIDPKSPLTLYNHTDNYVKLTTPASLYIDFDFDTTYDSTPSDEDKCKQLSLIIEYNENLSSLALPDTIKWAVTTPVFYRDQTYFLSFVKYSESVIGVWTVLE